jgi:hypothetical protein
MLTQMVEPGFAGTNTAKVPSRLPLIGRRLGNESRTGSDVVTAPSGAVTRKDKETPCKLPNPRSRCTEPDTKTPSVSERVLRPVM